jgi:hypothetical protein
MKNQVMKNKKRVNLIQSISNKKTFILKEKYWTINEIIMNRI